jgi:CelD/BcsL family acetyltransferase involved in cellulose biosynthesis
MILELPNTEKELLTRASASLLKNVAYLRRRLEREVGSVTEERHALRGDCCKLLNVVANIESSSWVAQSGGDTKFVDARYRNFWSHLSLAENWNTEVVVWLLRAGKYTLSFSAHIETERTLHVVANGYDERWKSYSPGSLLSREVLVDACRRGRRWLNWGQGDSGYKQRWGARDTEQLLDLMLFSPTTLGRAMLQIGRWRLPQWRHWCPSRSSPLCN